MNGVMPLVSIGLPVYNGGDYLRQTLEDFLAQSYSNFEMILSDNASTDATEELCRCVAARDSRIRYVRQPQNIGGGPNHNFTYRQAKGELFKWAGHDDRHEPTYLEACVKPFLQMADVALVYPKTTVIDEVGQRLYDYEDNFHMSSSEPYLRLRRVLEQPNSELLNPSLGLFRRAIFEGRDPDGGYFASDRVILAEIALHGRFHEVPERLFARRIYTDNYWSAGNDEQVQTWFDPASKGKVMAPRLRKFAGYWASIQRVPMPPSQKLRCLAELLRFYTQSDRISGAIMDMRLIHRRWLRR